MTGIDQEKWKAAMVQHFCDQKFSHVLTLAWNREVPMAVAKNHLRAIHRVVDRELLGPRFHQRPRSARTLAAFVFEGVGRGGHLHAHSLWAIRDRRHLIPFAKLFPGRRGGMWNKIVPSGSYALALNDDPRVSAGYALKGQHVGSAEVEIVWSLDFLRPE